MTSAAPPGPSPPATLVEMLSRSAGTRPDQTAFLFEEAPDNYQPYTYGWLWEKARGFAGALQCAGVAPGDRVAMALRNGPFFFAAFYGTLLSGAVAVPLFHGADAPRCRALMARCGARHLVLPPGQPPSPSFQALAQENSLHLCPADATASPAALPALDPAQVAFIQYTSGSTADPRGVQLTHRGLLTNVRQMIAGMRITAEEVFVSWLPVYHDMGLILMTMVPFYLGARLVLLPTGLPHPARWLRAVERHQGTFVAAPDTAYRLCVRATRTPETYDLASLRVALNAAEPVRPHTMEAFEDAFGLRHVMVAGYGLAEATVGVSMAPPGTTKKVDAAGRVSVGPPFPEIDVRIVENDRCLPAGEVGEIAVRSPALTPGYYDNPAANARLWGRDGFLLTGDLGYRDADGHLFVVARKKNVIKHAARTLYPADIEEIVEALPEVRRAAAVGLTPRPEAGEQLYLFAELRRHNMPSQAEGRRLVTTLVQRIHARLGVRPGRVYLLQPRTLPFTPNGKLQHQRLKTRYLDGTLQAENSILYPAY